MAPSFQRGVQLHQRGDLRGAERVYGAILADAPRHFGALHLIGLIKAQQGAFAEAHRYLSQAVAIEPHSVPALSTLAGVLAGLGRNADALAVCDRIISLDARNHDAYYNRGLALAGFGQHADALASYDKALALKPDLLVALLNRGTVLVELKRFDEAIATFDRVLALNPRHAEAHNNRGAVLAEMDRLDEALASYDRALALRPDHAGAHNNRGLALHRLDRPEEALAAFDRALAIKPDYADPWNNRGLVLHDLLRHEEALADYARALSIRPDYAEAHLNQGLTQLCDGDLTAGWASYQWRWKAKKSTTPWRDFPQPLWLGDGDLAEKTILLHAEQGLGDTIQFCRYATLVAARGARVILEVQRPLASLLASIRGVDRVVARGEPLPDFDLHCPLLSLPLAFRTDLQSVPTNVPYVFPSEELVRKTSATFAAEGRMRVGLAWSGSAAYQGDRKRSIPLAKLAPILTRANVDFFVIQRDIRPDDATVMRAYPNVVHTDLDMPNIAALISQLDLVLSVDTSLAHLTGALGRPVWVLLPLVPHWPWMLEREDSPWYPTARLFRQRRPGEWEIAIDRAAEELASMAAMRQFPSDVPRVGDDPDGSARPARGAASSAPASLGEPSCTIG